MGLRNRQLYQDKNIFFITTTCYRWYKLLVVGQALEIVASSIVFCCKKYEADILAYVLMPNHIHLIIYFKEANNRIDFMRDFKKFTSIKVRQEVEKIDMELLETKLNYIHNNPLQPHWMLCNNIQDYLYSSASYYEKGIQNKIEVKHYLDNF